MLQLIINDSIYIILINKKLQFPFLIWLHKNDIWYNYV